jgi:hypothetical protein
MNLYDLTANYKNLLDLLDNPEVPQNIIEQSLNEVAEEIEVKAENIAKLIKSIDIDAKALKEEEQRLASKRKTLENRTEYLKKYLEAGMRATSKEKIKGKFFSLAIQKNAPSVNVIDESKIPENYFTITKKLNKEVILEELKSGKTILGAELKQSQSLRIR